MATLVLGAGGAALGGAAAGSIGGPIGTIVGFAIGSIFAAAGSVIDSTLVFPAIFGKGANQIHGPRISDFPLTGASPGSPGNVCLGRQNRTTGTIIWIAPLKTITNESSVGGKGGGNVTSYQYTASLACAICEGPVNAIRKVWADGRLIYDDGRLDNRFKSITFYLGVPTQNPDPVIESYEGTGNVPAFRNTAYMVLEDFKIQDWGNRVPNFTFLVEGEEQTLLDQAVTRIFTRAGIDPAKLDTQWLQGVEVRGYTLEGPQEAAKVLEPLVAAFDIVVQDYGGALHFRLRSDVVPTTIPASFLAAGEEGQTVDRPVKLDDVPTYTLPQEVTVTYIDPDFSWQRSAQRERMNFASNPVVQTVELPFVLDGSTCRGIARRILWTAQAERQAVTLQLPPSQLNILESDLLTTVIDGVTYNFRVTQVNRGANWLIEVKGVTEDINALSQTAQADVPVIDPDPSPQSVGPVTFVAMEIPILPQDDYRRIEHWAVCMTSSADQWRNGRIFETSVAGAPDAQPPYILRDATNQEGTIGQCTTTLPSTGPLGFWDRTTTLTVQIFNGTLASVTEAQALQGYNMFYVGTINGSGEIIIAQNCTLVSANTYTLSKILRGRRGTEDKMTHGSGDYIVQLFGAPGVNAFSYGINSTNKTEYYKVLAFGQHLPDVAQIPVVRAARSVMPFSVAYLQGSRDSGGNLNLSWIRRSVSYFKILDFAVGAPLDFPAEEYDIEIHDLADNLKRAIRIKDQTTWSYTAAMQSSDGIGGAGTVKVHVWQVNRDMSAVGRGVQNVTIF